MITAEEFAEWKEHPVTKEIFVELHSVKEELKNKLSEGATIGMTAEETHGATNKIVGQIEGLNQLLNVSYADEKDDNDVSDVTGH